MNSREIKEKKFEKARMFGYNTEDVDLFLNELAQAFDNAEREKAVLEKKIKILAERIEEYRKDENSMKEALLGAQRLGNSVVAEAQEKASKMLAEAQEKADTMIKEAERTAAKAVSGTKSQIEKEQQALLKMQKEVSNFKARLLTIYKSHLDLITALPEAEGKAAAEESSAEPAPVSEEKLEAVEVSESAPQEPVKVAEHLEASAKAEASITDPIERAKKELENTQQIAKKQLGAVNGDLDKTQQISFAGNSQRIPFKSERVDMEKSFESKFGELKFGKNNK